LYKIRKRQPPREHNTRDINMRIAKQQLKRIIREEYDDAVSEDPYATHWPAEDPEESKHRLTGPELRAFLRYLGVDPDNLPESDPLTPEEVADIQAAAEEAIAARTAGKISQKENTKWT